MSQRAFSLIEMLISIAIICVIAVISLQGWKTYSDRSRDQRLLAQLSFAIRFARMEAQVTHQTIGLCPSNHAHTCEGKWIDGQLVFLDENEDGKIWKDEQILASSQSKKEAGNIHWRSFPVYRHYLQFSSTGMMGNDNGSFWYCRANNEKPRWAIILNQAGRERVAYPDQHGEIKDTSGKPLLCDQT